MMTVTQESEAGMTPQEVEKALTERLIRHVYNLAKYDCRCNSLRMQIPDVKKMDDSELSAFMHSFTLLQELNNKIDRLRCTFFEDTKRDFDSLFQNRPLDLQMIREAVHIILQSIRRARLFGYESSEGFEHFKDSLLPLENAITTAYLCEWLTNDQASWQTIHGFSMYPYKKEDRYKHGEHELEPSSLRRMYRKKNVLKMYQALRKNQQVFEKTPVEADNEDGIPPKPDEMNLILLTWINAYSDGSLDMLDYLFSNQYLMSTGKDAQTKKERGLSRACRKYQEFVQKTHDLFTGDGAPVEHNRQYVASSLLLYQLERSYQFHLNGRIAQRLCEGDIKQSRYNPNLAKLISGRFTDNDICLFLPKYTQEGFTYENLKPDVLNYIDCMYCTGAGKEPLFNTGLHSRKRMMAADARVLLLSLFPPKEQHAWSDRDFVDTANFLRNDYPITKDFLNIPFPEIPDGRISKDPENSCLFYHYYRDIYVNLGKDEGNLLTKGREKWIEIKNNSKQPKN